jgi:hypothetical protein
MYKIIYFLIIIATIHFTLYYFNFDLNIDTFFDFFKKQNITFDTTQINESINELKTLNECINNGEINTSFS